MCLFQVVVFQTYENQINNPIEAKYVFPLDDSAAVCGFEVFIKGKHIIGEVRKRKIEEEVGYIGRIQPGCCELLADKSPAWHLLCVPPENVMLLTLLP